jgi:signal transduction histidine kinase
LIEIEIKDSGIGFKVEEKSKIFSNFFRASNAIRTEPDGTGIGLYISRDIVEKHGGSLWYESSQDGSSFHFTLPLRRKSL